MEITEHTQLFRSAAPSGSNDLSVTVFDGNNGYCTYRLADFCSPVVTFGRAPESNIVLHSGFVSRNHGMFVFQDNCWSVRDNSSKNGTMLNGYPVQQYYIHDGDVLNIYDSGDNAQGVLMVIAAADGVQWNHVALQPGRPLTVGRDSGNDIVLQHVSVSKRHASFVFDGNTCWVQDMGSTNGTFIAGQAIRGQVQLREKDIIYIADTKLVYCAGSINYCSQKKGIRLDAQHIVRSVTGKDKVICNDVTLTIEPCEMVAIIGGSGAGKTTFMNCISGYSIPTKGRVLINGLDLYNNYHYVKNIIGYVPQQDIVYDGLTLESMLQYAAKLRLPADSSKNDIQQAINRVLAMVDLTDRKDMMIKNLSGGQKKRASIAVELLSDPNLFFLDEPASGLDPGMERSLMQTLKKMAASGKTVIMVTHSTLNLKMFDKIVFMGKGGNLCFYGTYEEACRFFNVDDIVDVYNMITDQSDLWKQKYLATRPQNRLSHGGANRLPAKSGREISALRQFFVLNRRYLHLIVNDRMRLLLMIGLPLLLTLLISMVAKDNKQFVQFEMTQALLFSLACSSYFIGTLNSIQEVCKERNILRREYMTGLKLRSYIASKIIVLALICLLQSLLSTGLFFILVGSPEECLIMQPFPEFLLTVFLTSWASSVMGVFVSCLVKNADRAMALAPLLLMPQLLFSGVIFELEGVTKAISWLAACRWSMEALGSSANLNELESRVAAIKHEPSDMYTFENGHLISCWIILLVFVIVFSALAGVILMRIKSERK